MLGIKVLAGAVFVVIAQAAVAQPPARFEFAEDHMGTRVRMVVYAADEPAAKAAARAAFDRIAELNRIMSDYLSTSELMQLCRQAGGPPVKVSPELFFVLERSQEFARLTDGAFRCNSRARSSGSGGGLASCANCHRPSKSPRRGSSSISDS